MNLPCQPLSIPTTRNLIIMDIDECCLSVDARVQHYIDGDVAAYHREFRTDVPIPQGVATYMLYLKYSPFKCIFVTGRPEAARSYTLAQLSYLFKCPPERFHLLMRPNGMTPGDMPDEQMKPWLIEQAGYSLDQVFMVFEDRQKNVDAFRKLGLIVYQTAPNDF